jgi:hypothetical protein
MSAFQNGFLFLELEQYLSAQQCFKAVLAEFPDCYEAWANLGYTQLMRYCDGLDADDLRHYGIGQVVAGGFYTRPASLESKVRGADEKLWRDAVKALNRALALKGDLVLPRASLGVAYLVHPEGKDVKQADRWFTEALARYKKDPELRRNPLSFAALLNNAGVADLARGEVDAARFKWQTAAEVSQAAAFTPLVKTLEEALLYNQALLAARAPEAEGKRRAHKLLELYLLRSVPDSAWWALAYGDYARLAKESGLPARPRDELARRQVPTLVRLLTSVTVDGQAVTLSEPTAGAVGRLGKDAGVAMPLFPGSKIVRWRFAARGLDLLGKDKVVAIFLTSPKAPPVTVQATGLGARPRELRVGMTEKEANEVLKDQRSDRGLYALADPRVGYRFYPEIGLAVRFGNDRVEEMAIAQVPRRRFLD